MTTEEIILKKKEAQEKITEIINTFVQETGFQPDGITLTFMQGFGSREKIGNTTFNISLKE